IDDPDGYGGDENHSRRHFHQDHRDAKGGIAFLIDLRLRRLTVPDSLAPPDFCVQNIPDACPQGGGALSVKVEKFSVAHRARGSAATLEVTLVWGSAWRIAHGVYSRSLPNGSRLSCARHARGRKAVERQIKRLAGEA